MAANNIILVTLLALITKNTYGAEIAESHEAKDIQDFYLEPQEGII